jgi:hypothetical protein
MEEKEAGHLEFKAAISLKEIAALNSKWPFSFS